jgi:hypothetical protein
VTWQQHCGRQPAAARSTPTDTSPWSTERSTAVCAVCHWCGTVLLKLTDGCVMTARWCGGVERHTCVCGGGGVAGLGTEWVHRFCERGVDGFRAVLVRLSGFAGLS